MENQNTKKPLVNVKALSMMFKVRGTLFKALDEIGFTVNEGDFFGVIGESGSGKSTTGKCLIRLNIPSGGKIEIANHLLSGKKLTKENNQWLKQNIQMVFQDPYSSINPTKNVLTVISEPLVISKTVFGETKQYLKSLQKLSFKVKKTLLRNDIELETKFHNNFFKTVIKQINESLFNFEDLDYKDLKPSHLRQRIINETDKFIEKIRSEFALFYDFYANQSVPLQKALDDANSSLTPSSVIELKNQLKALQKQAKISKAAWDILQALKQNQKELKDYENYVHFELQKKPRIYLNTWLLTTKSYIKDSKQNMQLTDDIFAFSYNSMVDKKRNLVLILSKYYKLLPYFYDQSLFDNADQFDEIANLIFFDLVETLLGVTSLFNDALAADKVPLIKFAKFLNKLCDLRFLTLKKSFNKTRVSCSFSFNSEPEILFANSCYDLQQMPQIIKPFWEKLFNEQNYQKIIDSVSRLNVMIANDITKAFEIKKTIDEKLREFKQQNLALKKAYSANKKSEANKASINELKVNLKTLKKQLKQEKNTTKKQSKKELKPLLKEHHTALKLHDEFNHDLRKWFKKLNFMVKKYNRLENSQKKFCLVKKLKALFKKQDETLQSELRPKLKTFGVINFEYKRAVKESNVFRLVHFAKNIFKPFLFFNLTKIFMRNKVYEALDSVGLKREHAYRYPHEFSGGQRQRIAIARALITKPKLIIADELISALDVSIQAQVINILKDLAKKHNLTVLFIAHDLSMVQTVCNRLIIMHRGKIVERGSVDEIFSNPVHPYTRSLIKASPKLSKINVDLASFDENFTYDSDYSLTNMPFYIKVPNSEEHELYCTQKQFDSWIKEATPIN
ncbi:ATP-binding cassette domain-containing protein [Mycoplasmoides genitalium]|uniref:ATP-binding cassette domain-containing protein n=1 Tax=Mycoplasmoides genitalium TaxID=2097 RepID=UPI00027B3980|nr:ATP-binding cassette domain-containing protein [Mycoplasmoides genitalium]AFQ02896.1 peptide ABC transporter ATP-binding protein [Mycoplasmoides genitalium M2321]